MQAWLTVVGIGEDGLDGLPPAVRVLIDQADILVGGERHLSMVPATTAATRHPWPSPFTDARPMLNSFRGKNVVVLASGDPQWFGAGATLGRWFPPGEMRIIPHPGAFSLAAARLGWPLQDCLCLSVHGRPLDSLRLHCQPGRRMLVLCEDASTPALTASLLTGSGYGPSRLIALEHLDGPAERILEGTAENWPHLPGEDLVLLAIELRLAAQARPLALVPGLPDDAFENDGQLTKREVRAVTLSTLAPLPGESLWDVGAGCGSIAIEWMRAGGMATAIESRPERVARIARNALALGVPGLDIVHGTAPEALPYTDPDAVFIGGGVSAPGMLESCWSALKPGGRLVANAVTAEAEAALLAFRQAHGGQLIRLSVARLAPVGGFHSWHPFMPITQYWGRRA